MCSEGQPGSQPTQAARHAEVTQIADSQPQPWVSVFYQWPQTPIKKQRRLWLEAAQCFSNIAIESTHTVAVPEYECFIQIQKNVMPWY